MLKEITIKKYLGLENFTVSDLNTINIITGENGVGKTSLLGHIYHTENCLDSGRVVMDAPIAIQQLHGRIIANLNGPLRDQYMETLIKILPENMTVKYGYDGEYIVSFNIFINETEEVKISYLGKGKLRLLEIATMMFDVYRIPAGGSNDGIEVALCIDNIEFSLSDESLKFAWELILNHIWKLDHNQGVLVQLFVTTHDFEQNKEIIKSLDGLYSEGDDSPGATYKRDLFSNIHINNTQGTRVAKVTRPF